MKGYSRLLSVKNRPFFGEGYRWLWLVGSMTPLKLDFVTGQVKVVKDFCFTGREAQIYFSTNLTIMVMQIFFCMAMALSTPERRFKLT